MRHADDMFCQGYNVEVVAINSDRILLRKNHSTSTMKTVYFIAPKRTVGDDYRNHLREFSTRWEKMIKADVPNLFSTYEDARRVVEDADSNDFWEVLSHEIEEIFLCLI